MESAQLLGNGGGQSGPDSAGQHGKQDEPRRRGPSAVQRHSSHTNPEEEEGMPEYTLPQCLVRAHAWKHL